MATGSSTDADDTFTTIVALVVAGFVTAVGTAFLVAGRTTRGFTLPARPDRV